MGNNELISNFKHFDRDGNGQIDFGEFSELLDALGAGMSDEQKRIGFEAIDTNGNKKIEYDEFAAWWSELD
jgi:Ca2+-binding EF-hand superfamily protein